MKNIRLRTGLMLILTAAFFSRAGAQTLSEELIQQANIIVDINGTGDYTTVQEGIDAIPDYNDQWLVLLIKKGVYHEKVILNHKKTKVILVGEDVDSTIITHDDYGNKMLPGGHTFSTYTFRADPHDFQAYNITFENPTRLGQGVAYHSNGDRQILHHCRLIGYQDTYFDNFRTRRYIQDCFIEGKTDYIFGFGVTLFDSCQIHMVESDGYMTAAATPEHYEFGYVFKNCRLTSDPKVVNFSLGRPWFPYSNTIFYECWEPSTLTSTGWSDWDGRGATCIYREYNCFGPGSGTDKRVSFSSQLEPSMAPRYNTDTILAASNFPSELGELVDSMELWSMRNRFEESGYADRADTILYAGRDHFPEYPADDWSPVFYDPIHSIIEKYTVPFMDSINGVLEIENLYWNGNPLEGFRPDSFNYVVELPADDTVPPVFMATGSGATTITKYNSGLIGTATVSVLSRDRVNGQYYSVYISKDSAYWSTLPYFMVFNYKDTIYMEKGVDHYEINLSGGDTRVRNISFVGVPDQKSKFVRPSAYPGEVVITTVSPGKTDTATYYLTVYWPVSLDEKAADRFGLEILNPVSDRMILRCDKDIPGNSQLVIYDLNGKMIFFRMFEEIPAGITEIDLGSEVFKPGFYIYRIDSGSWNRGGKIIKYR